VRVSRPVLRLAKKKELGFCEGETYLLPVYEGSKNRNKEILGRGALRVRQVLGTEGVQTKLIGGTGGTTA